MVVAVVDGGLWVGAGGSVGSGGGERDLLYHRNTFLRPRTHVFGNSF